MKATLISVFCFFLLNSSFSQKINVSSGSVKRFANFSSAYVDARNVEVWLPEGYTPSNKYAVLYMHDGQMLFDSTSNWNKQEWGVDETMGRLIQQEKIKDCIVVAVWNTGSKRHADYFPQKPFESLPKQQQDSIYTATATKDYSLFAVSVQSDKYLKFLVTELKPFIDINFSTLKDLSNTFIAGSSMGGLISMYAICEYPAVFGGAACLSTHWPGLFTVKDNPVPEAFMNYLKYNLPDPATHKIYFDYGTATLDSLYKPFHFIGLNDVAKQLTHLLKPSTLLDILQYYTVYATNSKKKKIKVVCRYQQYEGANAIVQRVREGEIKKGLIWHFQGSGKSLLMLFAAQKLRKQQDLFNPTVIIVVDRVDLDTQITATFNTADVPNMITTESIKELHQLLEQDTRKIIVTMVHKFKDAYPDMNKRGNIILMVDEAHRTQ